METNTRSVQQFIDDLLRGKENFDSIDGFVHLIGREQFRSMLLRIFDTNDGEFPNESDAHLGLIGRLNGISRWWRGRVLRRRLRSLDRATLAPSPHVIVAEGDSWFEYPIIADDILDHLIRARTPQGQPKYLLHSQAAGADWLSNMIYQEEYIEALSRYQPQTFLISGGGNDLIGDRLAVIVRPHEQAVLIKPSGWVFDPADLNRRLASSALEGVELPQPHDGHATVGELVRAGMPYLQVDFKALLHFFYLQYRYLFTRLRSIDKFKTLQIITQGYDFAIPTRKWGLWPPTQWQNGKWLYRPLQTKRVPPRLRRAVIAAMLFWFNEMLMELARKDDHVYHLDVRGCFLETGNWIDELHLDSKASRRVAEGYQKIIDTPEQPRTYQLRRSIWV